jgi:Subtilase family
MIPMLTFHLANMSNVLRSLCTVLVSVLLVIAANAQAASAVPGEVLVKLRSPAGLGPIVATYPGTVSTQFGSRPIYRLKLPAGSNVTTVLASLLANPDVLLAEAHYTHQSPEARRSRAWAVGEPSAYTAQWAPTAMRLPLAHTFSKGLGVKVAVLDTGVDLTHPALAGKLLPGYDFVDGDTDPSEVPGTAPNNLGYGHGTHVAGLIALVAPDAKIIPYRVLDPNGEGNAWVLMEAVLRAIDDGAQIINLSLGTPDKTDVLTSIAKLVSCEPSDENDPILNFSDPGYAADKARCVGGPGVMIVAAAGNDGSSAVKEFPAAVSAYGLLSVTASDNTRHLATFGNFGSWVQVAAPGDGITSLVPMAAPPPGGGLPTGYAVWSGTSMAAPLAAGAAALLRSLEPNLPAKDLVRRIARDTPSPLINAGNIGQVDAAALVERCKMDIDGDGQILATTDGLMLMRALAGMTDTAVMNVAAPGANRKTWAEVRQFLTGHCGLTLP